MSRVHDMGGRHGERPVRSEPQDAPVFKAPWQARAHALTSLSMPLGGWSIDARRHGRERLFPDDYMRLSYYERWLAGLANMLVEGGILTARELATGQAEPAPAALRRRRVPAEAVALAPTPYDRATPARPRFAPGAAVRSRRRGNLHVEGGHTRLPGYAARARGKVIRCHGVFVFPDTNAHGLGEAPEPLYAVAFPASELWTHPEHPRDEVIVDLWESYLEADG